MIAAMMTMATIVSTHLYEYAPDQVGNHFCGVAGIFEGLNDIFLLDKFYGILLLFEEMAHK